MYNLVWSSPTRDVATKLNTSDNDLRKICKANHIPMPKSGHWMKIRFGKPVDIEPLDEK